METTHSQLWPEQENACKLPFDILREELRISRTNADFQESILGLDNLYRYSPLTDSFRFYATTAAELIARQHKLKPDPLYESIYTGSLLGLYAGIYRYPQAMKDAIIECAFNDTPDAERYPSESPDAYINRCLETYSDDIDDRFGTFETLQDNERSILTLIADRACSHLGQQYESYFIAGVMKSFHQLRPIIDYYYGQTAGN